MRAIRVLCICGTGTVGANVVMSRLQEIFDEHDIPAQLITGSSLQVGGMVGADQTDMIVTTSIMPEVYEGIPTFLALPLYTGIGEEELIEGIVEAAQEIKRRIASNEG